MSRLFFRSQEDDIKAKFNLFVSDYAEEYGEKSFLETDVNVVWSEFKEQLVLRTDLNDCYNIQGIPGLDDEFIILREFCSCHDPAVDAEWEIDAYLEYIKDNPEEFYRVYKQYQDRVDRTDIRESWGIPSADYFTGIVNGIPVPDYTSALFNCKESLVFMCKPKPRAKQKLLAAFPKDELFYTTIFARHIAAYHGKWVSILQDSKHREYEKYKPMRDLVSRWRNVAIKPTRYFATGDRHGKVSFCLVPGCGGWSNSRLGTYVTKEEVKEQKTHKQKKDAALKITVEKSNEKLKKDNEQRREKRKAKVQTEKQKRDDRKKKREKDIRNRFDAATRALDKLKIDYVENKDEEVLTSLIVERVRSIRPYQNTIQRLKNIKHYFSETNKESRAKIDELIAELEAYFAGKKNNG